MGKVPPGISYLFVVLLLKLYSFTFLPAVFLPNSIFFFWFVLHMQEVSKGARIRTWLYVPSTPHSFVLVLMPALDLPFWPVQSQEGSLKGEATVFIE